MASRTKPQPEPAPEPATEPVAIIKPETAPEPTGAEPLIDLDDIAPERPTIRYKGRLVEMRLIDDFGIEDHQRLNRDNAEFSELYSSTEELSEDQTQRLRMLLERLFDMVAPDELADAGLTDTQKAQVILGFKLAPLARQMAREQPATDTE